MHRALGGDLLDAIPHDPRGGGGVNVAPYPAHLDFISLCTGAGGLELGLELALPSARPVCMVEREAFAAAHLVSAMRENLLAECPIWSDARTFDGRAWRGCVDGVIGGIPCQPHSAAGKRRGKDDERDLWPTARRILVQSGAWFFFLENVAGMLDSGGAERVCREFRRLGFALEGGLFTAAEIGAPHRRERLFILAVADRESDVRRAEFEARRARGGRPGFAGIRDQLADADGAQLEGLGRDDQAPGREIAGRSVGIHGRTALADASGGGRDWRQDEPIRRADRRGFPDRPGAPADGLGDTAGAGPFPAAFAGTHPGESSRGPRHAEPERRGGALADAAGDGRREGRPEPDLRDWRHAAAGAGLFPPGPADISGWRHTLERAPELEPAFRRVADGLATRLDIGRVDRLRLLGNGVVPLAAAHAFRTLSHRLAERGSARAAWLVSMMEAA